MKTRIKREEYTTLGDFILPSFERDQAAIVALFPKFDMAFLNAFTSKLTFVKGLESSLVKTEARKEVTVALHTLASDFNDELTILKSYLADAGLSTHAVSAVKRDLFNGNMEGAILKAEGVRQYVVDHQAQLEAEGMPAHYESVIANYKTRLEEKNTLQNNYMNALKELTETNRTHYDELYKLISKIVAKGKIVVRGTIRVDEYVISKNIRRMRAAKLRADPGDSQT